MQKAAFPVIMITKTAGENVFLKAEIAEISEKGERQMEEQIKEAIENIRPYLQSHGGDVEFVSFDQDGVVKVRLQGACHACAGAQMTIKNGVQRILQEAFPEVTSVEAV